MATEPEDFIVRFAGRIRPGGRVLDVACGAGRHALFLARLGHPVLALDRSAEHVESLREIAVAENLDLEAVVADVEAMSLLDARFDAIVNTLFLWRDLFDQYAGALRPGGVLFFRTFTTDNADVLGHDRPGRRFLLAPGELETAFPSLRILHSEETTGPDRAMATLVASARERVTE